MGCLDLYSIPKPCLATLSFAAKPETPQRLSACHVEIDVILEWPCPARPPLAITYSLTSLHNILDYSNMTYTHSLPFTYFKTYDDVAISKCESSLSRAADVYANRTLASLKCRGPLRETTGEVFTIC